MIKTVWTRFRLNKNIYKFCIVTVWVLLRRFGVFKKPSKDRIIALPETKNIHNICNIFRGTIKKNRNITKM